MVYTAVQAVSTITVVTCSNPDVKLLCMLQSDVENVINKLVPGDVQLRQLWKWIGNILSVDVLSYFFCNRIQ